MARTDEVSGNDKERPSSAVSPNQAPDLAWLLRGLGEEVPVIRGSVLLSADGMLKAAHGFDRVRAVQLAALASGLFSIARSAGMRFDNSNEVRRAVTKLKSTHRCSPSAGCTSVL